MSGDSVSLAFASAPDYENPGSADSDNDYSVTVTISDGTNTGSTISYTVSVADSTAIVITSGQSASVAENAAAGATVMTVAITESTPTNVLISAGNGDGIFAISNSGVITIDSTTNLDYETDSSYTLSIVAYDASTSDVADVTITITDANDAPSAGADQTGSVTEDASTTTATGTISGTDADTGDTLTYTGATTGTYGSITLSGAAWTYTIDNSDADTTALDAGDSVTDAFTMTVSTSKAAEKMTVEENIGRP